jgi:hypothetical protein
MVLEPPDKWKNPWDEDIVVPVEPAVLAEPQEAKTVTQKIFKSTIWWVPAASVLINWEFWVTMLTPYLISLITGFILVWGFMFLYRTIQRARDFAAAENEKLRSEMNRNIHLGARQDVEIQRQLSKFGLDTHRKTQQLENTVHQLSMALPETPTAQMLSAGEFDKFMQEGGNPSRYGYLVGHNGSCHCSQCAPARFDAGCNCDVCSKTLRSKLGQWGRKVDHEIESLKRAVVDKPKSHKAVLGRIYDKQIEGNIALQNEAAKKFVAVEKNRELMYEDVGTGVAITPEEYAKQPVYLKHIDEDGRVTVREKEAGIGTNYPNPGLNLEDNTFERYSTGEIVRDNRGLAVRKQIKTTYCKACKKDAPEHEWRTRVHPTAMGVEYRVHENCGKKDARPMESCVRADCRNPVYRIYETCKDCVREGRITGKAVCPKCREMVPKTEFEPYDMSAIHVGCKGEKKLADKNIIGRGMIYGLYNCVKCGRGTTNSGRMCTTCTHEAMTKGIDRACKGCGQPSDYRVQGMCKSCRAQREKDSIISHKKGGSTSSQRIADKALKTALVAVVSHESSGTLRKNTCGGCMTEIPHHGMCDRCVHEAMVGSHRYEEDCCPPDRFCGLCEKEMGTCSYTDGTVLCTKGHKLDLDFGEPKAKEVEHEAPEPYIWMDKNAVPEKPEAKAQPSNRKRKSERKKRQNWPDTTRESPPPPNWKMPPSVSGKKGGSTGPK